MITLMDLWLPIVLSAIAVFIAGAIAWMALPHHKDDYKKLSTEDAVLASIRANAVPPGQYMFPYCGSPADMKDSETKRRYEAGPHGILTVWPGAPSMGKNLALNFLFNLGTSVFVGYIASRALPRGAQFLDVFQLAGTTGILGYAFGGIPHGIWMGRKPRSLAMDFMDGTFYGLVTGAVFAALWPAVST
jgi:hypothetical protein